MFDCPDLPCHQELVVHLASYHEDRSQGFNEQNLGLGLRWRAAERWFWGAGFYRNSIRHESAYVGLGWEPVKVGPVALRLVAGAVTGYQVPVAPFVLPEVAVAFGRYGVAVNYLPAIELEGAKVGGVIAMSVFARF